MDSSTNKFSWKARARSFSYAWNGIKYVMRYEHNARLHSIATILVVAFGILFSISPIEWCVILMCIGIVFSGECINSAIEKVCDKVEPDKDPLIGIAKDAAAGAVLISAIASVIIAAIIFIPKILNTFQF